MKKIGILTINDNNNYGNRLQNYALSSVLKKLNVDVANIKNSTQYSKIFREHNNMILLSLKLLIVRILRGKEREKKEREKKFREFNQKYIPFSSDVIDERIDSDKERNLIKKYDYFVLGSDQIWNPNFPRTSVIDFALFAPKEKVISYAASFGVSEIPQYLTDFYKNGLNHVEKISVREEQGMHLVKKIVDREAEVVLDPTLLIEQEEWRRIANKPSNIPSKRFIVTCFLGNMSKERKIQIERIAKKQNMSIVHLGKKEYLEYYTAGPSEFLWYIQNAEMILTDSFHACVFSILFDKTFYIMEREENIQSMNSRIDTLLKKFRLPDRKLENWNQISFQHDYSHVKEILNEEQKKSINFLKKALNIKE